MSEAGKCSKCGHDVHPDVLGGKCPQCLMKAGHDHFDGLSATVDSPVAEDSSRLQTPDPEYIGKYWSWSGSPGAARPKSAVPSIPTWARSWSSRSPMRLRNGPAPTPSSLPGKAGSWPT